MVNKKKEPITEESLDSIVESIRKLTGESKIGEGPAPWYLPSGNLALDYIISMKVDGTGGYPAGKVIEFFGDFSTGKSLFIAKAGAKMQSMGGIFAIADAERRWDSTFASIHGVNSEQTIEYYPRTVEEFTVTTYDLLYRYGNKRKMLIALDSLAALSTLAEVKDITKEGEMKADQGRRAQKIKSAMRVLPSLIQETEAIFLVANHIMAQPGAYTYTTPGGKGIPFHASVRLELLKSTPIKLEGKERPIGVTLRTKVAKNSIAPPFGEAEIELFWGKGIDPYSGLLDIAVDLGIVEKAGAWFKYKESSFHARDFGAVIVENPEILQNEVWNKPYFTEY